MRLFRRRRRPSRRRDFCETCGAEPRRIWIVGARILDASENEIGGEGGGSFMSATYCKAHRPAEARRKPNPKR